MIPSLPVLAIYPNKGTARTEFLVTNFFGHEWGDVEITAADELEPSISVIRQQVDDQVGWRVKAEFANVGTDETSFFLKCNTLFLHSNAA